MKKFFFGFNNGGSSLVEVLVALSILSIVIASMPSIIGMTSKLVFDSNNKKRNLEELICHVNGFEDTTTDKIDENLSSGEISFVIDGEENKIQIKYRNCSLKNESAKRLVTFDKL